jgi:hypothetical protein
MLLHAVEKIQMIWRRSHGMGFWAEKINNRQFFTALRNGEFSDPMVLMDPHLSLDFSRFVRRLLLRSGGQPCDWQPELMVCWMIAMNDERFPVPLSDAAMSVVNNFLDCLEENYGRIRDLAACLRMFALEYAKWRALHLDVCVRDLRADVVEELNTSLRNAAPLPNAAVNSMIEYQNLSALYCMLIGSATSFSGTAVFKAIVLASRNPCWSPAVSQARLLHELVLDNNLIIPFEQSVPLLKSRHTAADGRLVDSQQLRDDMMAVLIGFVNEAAWLEDIAAVFHETSSQSVDVMASHVFEKVFMPIASNTPIANQARIEWETRKHAEPLEALVHCLRMVQNVLDNLQVDVARQNMEGHFSTLTRQTWATMQVSQTVLSLQWISECIKTRASRPECIAIAAGNPYVLVEFFNTAILSLVLDSASVVDFLALDRLPEFLSFDRDRLVQYRAELSTLSFNPQDFLELINARKWMGRGTCPPLLEQIAHRLRTMLEFCRFCHGQSVSFLAIRAAREVIELSTP